LHQYSSQANPIDNRPEDFLATETQKEVCDEVLFRSWASEWDDVPVTHDGQVEDGHDVDADEKHFDRERTPRILQDLSMLDAIREEEIEPDENRARSSHVGAAALLGGPLEMQVAMPS
jgi:hypothetical protein